VITLLSKSESKRKLGTSLDFFNLLKSGLYYDNGQTLTAGAHPINSIQIQISWCLTPQNSESRGGRESLAFHLAPSFREN